MIKSFGYTTLLWLLFVLCYSRSNAAVYSYSGTLEKLPIYLSINFAKEEISATYFYKNKLVNIDLVGKRKNDFLYLSNDFGLEDEESIAAIETFKLKWNPKICTGTWTKGSRVLKVNLKALTAKELSHPKHLNNPYIQASGLNDLNKIKTGLFRLKSLDSVTYEAGIKVRHFREVNTGLTFFRVDSGYTQPQLVQINQFLESIHLDYFFEVLSCRSYSRYEVYFDVAPYRIFFNSEWMAFGLMGSFYCGGAHPDELTQTINFHIPSGKDCSLSEILNQFSSLDSDTHSEIFSEEVLAYFKQIKPDYFTETTDSQDMECEYNRPELWNLEMSAILQENGILLVPTMEHYRGFCNWPDWSFVPYKVIATHIDPRFKSIVH
jgi:hypothetical protein